MGKILKPKPKAAPVAKPVPIQDSATTDASRRKAMAQQQQRGGVAATVLSDTLGG